MSNNSLTFNSIDCGGTTTYGVTVTQGPSITALPALKFDSRSLAHYDGNVTHGASYSALRMRVGCKLLGTSSADAFSKLSDFMAVMYASREGEKTLSFDHLSGKQWQARLVGEVTVDEIGNGFDMELEFECNPPWASATSATTDGPDAIAGDTTVTFVNSGDLRTSCTYIVKQSAGGDASSVTISNTTTSQAVVWDNTLAASEWLKVTGGADWSCAVSTDSGTSYTTQNVNMSGAVPDLDPGNNSVRVIGSTGTVEVSYTPRYAI